MICKRKKMPEQSLHDVFQSLKIQKHKKAILQDRYLDVLHDFHRRSTYLTFMYYCSKIVITIGSILVPACLSIQGTPAQNQFYWVAWIISLLVTICNGLATIFKLDKKFFFIHTTLEVLQSEGWKYAGLTGRYAAKEGEPPTSHEDQFYVFFHMAEKIKMRQVEEEYWKSDDTQNGSKSNGQRAPIVSATPTTRQEELVNLPLERRTILDGWLEDIKKGAPIGLQPRSIIKPRTRIDGGGSSPSKIQGTTSETPMSIQSKLQKSPVSEVTGMQVSPTENESPKDTLVAVAPNESDEWERT